MSKIPFLRGLVVLWDALVLGMRALTISANEQGEEDEQIEGPLLYITLAVSLTFSIVLFFLAPATVGHYLGRLAEYHQPLGGQPGRRHHPHPDPDRLSCS